MRVLPEHAWEIRQELKEAQDAGKKVIIFIDNAQMTDYHLASVADKIMLDPQGSIMLPGYILGRTYFKGTLDKLGLGFNEWRYFKYKSAAEALSRKDMSEADSLQNQMFVN
ncbi:MAG: signal peptide peptidase SppA, partial [Calditrichae bacterium]|nr:signal peptide peptidase SppA [Calditrichia bacterium]